MFAALRTSSGFFFYLLGLSFLAAYLLHANNLMSTWPLWWMSVTDLSFLLTACIYGGLSLFASVSRGNRSRIVGVVIGIPLVVLFLLFVGMNYYEYLVARI